MGDCAHESSNALYQHQITNVDGLPRPQSIDDHSVNTRRTQILLPKAYPKWSNFGQFEEPSQKYIYIFVSFLAGCIKLSRGITSTLRKFLGSQKMNQEIRPTEGFHIIV